MHPFEKRELGKAPFRCVGMTERRGPLKLADGTEVGSPGQPMGTCRYCGTGIASCFEIASSDGKRFIVGSECVHKTTDEDRPGDLRLKREVNRMIRKATVERESRRIERAMMAFLVNPDRFEERTDHFAWMFLHAGHAGQLRVTREIESVIGKGETR